MANYLYLIAALWIGHALCDFPLQGEFLAIGKNRFGRIKVPWWYWCMGAHCAIHAGMVWVITGAPLLAALEFVAHWAIDDAKNAGRIGGAHAFDIGQGLHLGCKVLWATIFYFTVWGA